MRKSHIVIVTFEAAEGESLPSDETIRAVLAHSTAREALEEATSCTVEMELINSD